MTLVLAWRYRDIDDGRARQRGDVELDLSTNPCPAVQAVGIAGRGHHQVWLQRPVTLEDLMDPSVRLSTAAGGENWTGAGTYDLAQQPCPAVMAHGVGGAAKHQYWIERGTEDPRDGLDHQAAREAALTAPTPDDDRPSPATAAADTMERNAVSKQTGKPPYDVPTMDEVRAVPWNGLNVVTTFAGGGGSSTGYRMAGYRVLAAVEFVPAAQETYAANMAPYTHLFRRDVRDVTAADVLAATGLRKGQLDLLDGSPPCEPFSSAGQRDKKWGKVNPYSGFMQRSDDLFFVYAHLLAGLQPKTFVAENVAGLVRGRAKGYFKMIHRALQDAGYVVEARLLDAQWLGVPQTRQRLIFVGVRKDLADKYKLVPAFPDPLPYRYTVRDALPWIFRHGTDPNFDRRRREHMTVDDMMVESDTRPAGAVRTTSGNDQVEEGTTGAAGVVDAEPGSGDRVVNDTETGRAPGTGRPMRDHTDTVAPTVLAGDDSAPQSRRLQVERDVDLADLLLGDRAIHDAQGNRPPVDQTDRPAATVTTTAAQHHLERDADLADLLLGDRAVAGSFEQFHEQRDVTDQPVPAILAGQQWHQGIEADVDRAHQNARNGWRIVTLPDGRVVERRKFTINELKAICGFPPDYDIRGSFSVQWERLGDTHAPLQVHHIATAIRDNILLPHRAKARTKPYDITKNLAKLATARERLEQEAQAA